MVSLLQINTRIASLLCLALLCIATGCANTRTMTISADPPDALIKIDGKPGKPGPITQTFTFPDPKRLHYVVASKRGYREETKTISVDSRETALVMKLKKDARRVQFTVRPVAAILTDNGKPITKEPVEFFTHELEFTVDNRGNYTTHTIMAEAPNYANARVDISWIDPHEPNYVLELLPMRKNLVISTNPPSAQVYLDNDYMGVSPITDNQRAFAVNTETKQFIPVKVKIKKPGYDDREFEIGWDEGKTEYEFELAAKSKHVRIVTNPPGSTVTLNGKELPTDSDGASIASLSFAPIKEKDEKDDKGELPVYRGRAMKRGGEADWQPVDFAVAWDGGKTDYSVQLKEVLTKNVPLLTALWSRGANGVWDVEPKIVTTVAAKTVAENVSAAQKPVQLAKAPAGSSIDTIVVSPDGRQLLYTALAGSDAATFHSQMTVINTDGTGGVGALSDGRSLDLYPSFTPGGESIVFSSNRASARLSVWQAASSGAPGIQQLTPGSANEVWPDIDSDPRPRVYYQSLIDSRKDPQLFSSQLGTNLKTDMQISGTQPRVSPRNDALIYCGVNEKTGKRDLFRVTVREGQPQGQPQNLTNTPDVDESDPTWSHDGNRIAYASDGGLDVEKRRNLDIWYMDLNRPERPPTQLTTNGSQDDCPQWDPVGRFIYFRSNRGGEWGVWKIAVK